jgi:hypothetical protein
MKKQDKINLSLGNNYGITHFFTTVQDYFVLIKI